MQQRQDWLEDYLINNDFDTCSLVGSVTLETPIFESVNKLRETLNLEYRWAFPFATTEAAVNKVTEMLENAGIFVAYNGVVGNNTHRPLKVSECRGGHSLTKLRLIFLLIVEMLQLLNYLL